VSTFTVVCVPRPGLPDTYSEDIDRIAGMHVPRAGFTCWPEADNREQAEQAAKIAASEHDHGSPDPEDWDAVFICTGYVMNMALNAIDQDMEPDSRL
jgi:hypothetical protein